MTESLHKYINSFIQLSKEEIEVIEEISVCKKIKKNELIAENGKVCRKVLFAGEGYFRFFHIDSRGNEITSDFYFAPSFITSYTSFITGVPSFVNVQAMHDMDVLEFSKEDLYDLYDKYPKFERVGRLIAEKVAINSEEHLFLLLNQTAQTRYQRLLEQNPQYVNTIPLQYIASYLGITQETLSRMRKSIK
ncbi:MAG: Crp/Fnr family transcriptional regulator [Bacteroidales bacterium]|jgi:CRP-like cAMP-binding protein|nr:Crp/Fnr family transcriptional regulator [Bacteroidales bacterium]